MKRILVLGGSGFLGKKLSIELQQLGHQVTALDRSWLEKLEGINCIEVDVFDKKCLKQYMNNQDVVFHLVSTTVPVTSNKNPVFDCETNVVGTLNILEAMREAGVQKVIFASSGGTVYGISRNVPAIENVDSFPISAYGIGKIAIEKYLYLYSYLYGLQAVSLRLSNPYGPGQDPEKGQGVISTFLHRALNQESIEIWGDGSVVRDFIYIDDVIRAFVLAMKLDCKFEVMNIGSGQGKSLLEILSTIKAELGFDFDVVFKNSRPCDVPRIELNIDKSNAILGWQPECSLEQGVSRFVQDIRSKYTQGNKV
jgi:UDP-glucose 4-epimerase